MRAHTQMDYDAPDIAGIRSSVRNHEGHVMTKAEAAAIQAKWQEQVDPPVCEHPNQELEANETGYLTGNYYCTDCGQPIARKL